MTSQHLPNLNESVLAGLDFFASNRPPHLRLTSGSLAFVVGSVNAYHTGRLLFTGRPTIFADEGNWPSTLKSYRLWIKNKTIKEATIISASGEKDAIWEIKAAKRAGLRTTLLTCQGASTGAKLADRTLVFKKIPEPYSYNYSTYLGMILGNTQEDPKLIKKYLRSLKVPKNFRSYDYYSFILPDEFRPIVDMLKVKDDEMFGPYSRLRAYSLGNARHAKFICQSKKELVVSFGPNRYFGPARQRWEIKIPARAGAGLILSLSYYLSGLIQAANPPYFKKGLADYCLKTGPAPYGRKEPFPIIVS